MKSVKRIWLWLTIVCLFLSGCAKLHPKPPKVYRVGILSGLDFFANTADGFKAKMTELGYIEGKNIVYDLRKTNFDPEKEQAILNKFVADKVDLILPIGTDVSLTAKATVRGTGIPVVFTNANVEGVPLVDSVPKPGGNITGVRYPGPDIAVKRFEIMLELLPQAKRILIPYQRGYPIIDSQMEILRPVASAKGITLLEFPASNAAELKAELEKLEISTEGDIDCILAIPEPLAASPDGFTVLGKFAATHKVPMGGALMAIGDYESAFGVATNGIAVGGQAAVLADKIFKGIPAGDIAVVSAESYFQVSVKAAQKQGLNLSGNILGRADEIIR